MSAAPEDNDPYRATLPIVSRRRMNPNSLANLKPPFQPGNRANPGGSKGFPRVDIAYKRILAMSAEERSVFVPANGAEEMALRQFENALSSRPDWELKAAQEITNRTDGPIVRKVEKVDLTALEAERQRFQAAVDALVEQRGCSRADAAIVMAAVNPAYKRFLEPESP